MTSCSVLAIDIMNKMFSVIFVFLWIILWITLEKFTWPLFILLYSRNHETVRCLRICSVGSQCQWVSNVQFITISPLLSLHNERWSIFGTYPLKPDDKYWEFVTRAQASCDNRNSRFIAKLQFTIYPVVIGIDIVQRCSDWLKGPLTECPMIFFSRTRIFEIMSFTSGFSFSCRFPASGGGYG